MSDNAKVIEYHLNLGSKFYVVCYMEINCVFLLCYLNNRVQTTTYFYLNRRFLLLIQSSLKGLLKISTRLVLPMASEDFYEGRILSSLDSFFTMSLSISPLFCARERKNFVFLFFYSAPRSFARENGDTLVACFTTLRTLRNSTETLRFFFSSDSLFENADPLVNIYIYIQKCGAQIKKQKK